MLSSPIPIKSWNAIVPYIAHSSPLSFLISSSLLRQVGIPIVKAYQDALCSYPHLSLAVECDTVGQALSCLYHGIEKIVYRNPAHFHAIGSIQTKRNFTTTGS